MCLIQIKYLMLGQLKNIDKYFKIINNWDMLYKKLVF